MGAFSRLVPFIQPISPTANGGSVSTVGPELGACRASGTEAVRARAEAAGAGAATGAGAPAGTFITTSCRVALLASTSSAGSATCWYPVASKVRDQAPGGRSENEYTPSLPETVARMASPSAL